MGKFKMPTTAKFLRKKFVMRAAQSTYGFLPEAKWIYRAVKSKNEDYHSEMDAEGFTQWFTDLLLSLEIIMDNASYHSVQINRAPTSANKKSEIQDWLGEHGIIYDKKKDPVWVYLEREMQENLDKKPYNKKVGDWLKFLKDLKLHYFCEARRKYRRLNKEVGPRWYYEFSQSQRQTLDNLRHDIHQDLIEDLSTRTKKCLWDLGITLRFPHDMLMKAMEDSVEDPGLFIWVLYTSFYKIPPSELLPKYDMNAKLMVSAMVFADFDECIERLQKLAAIHTQPKTSTQKKKKTYYEPKVRYGEYLQKMYVPCYSNHPLHPKSEEPVVVLDYKVKLKSAESYESIAKKTVPISLEKRRERNRKEKQSERICTYKFWEPPTTLRNTDPKLAAFMNKMKMFKKKGKARYLKYKPPFENIQCHIGCLSYSGGLPRFLLQNFFTLPTGYIILNGGIVRFKDEFILNIQGNYKFPKDFEDKCVSTCDCVAIWEERVMKYIDSSKCQCHHNYDLDHTGKAVEKCFYPPTKHGPHWFDHAKIYNFDPWEDFVKDKVHDALLSEEPSFTESQPTLSISNLNAKQLIGALLGDLAESPLLIPHLPQANLLNNLQEWVRLRVQGRITPQAHKQMLLQSQRRWLDLKHMDFRARAYRIPFTLKQLNKMNYSHRPMIQKLYETLLRNFEMRSRNKQVEQTRLWWSTMKYDAYPSKAFLDVFFTYMPGRMKDTLVVNPYSVERTPHVPGKTCHLGI